MAIRKLAVMLPVALLVACQSDKAREQELEQRVQTLERQLLEAQMASPSPESTPAARDEETAGEAGRVAQAPRQRSAPAPVSRTQRPASSASGAAAPATASRGQDARSRPEEREPYDGRPGAGPVGGGYGDDGDDDRVEPVRPRATSVVLPEGTELHLVLEEGLSSATTRAGEPVTARVEKAVSEDGQIVLPGGTVLQGRVSDVRSSGRVSGRARIAVDFDRIVVRGRTHELDTSAIMVEAPSEAGRDAKIVGGSAAAGAVLGAIADGKKGAVRGAVIGAGAGGAAVLITKGREIELPAGSRWTVRVRSSARL